ncbi:MAG: class I SAM-dependent methyltransferase [Ferrovum sp.]|nr:class I SAM-dependent methyltransferase [Ferrovum sp.]
MGGFLADKLRVCCCRPLSGPLMFAHLALEHLSRQVLPRVPEPELVMDDRTQNEAFDLVGREDGLLAFVNLYHALQIIPLVRQGDSVLDMGCGPANQLVQMARLNPRVHFTGLDASLQMLDFAHNTVCSNKIENIKLEVGDMTTLKRFEDASFDCVVSTMSLHHLRDLTELSHTMRAVQRVLKPGGSLYFVDFGRLKRTSTQRFFSEDRRDCQPDKFTRDYFNSLRAAFSVEELTRELRIHDNVTRYATALAPFMVIFKSSSRREPDMETRRLAQDQYRRMTAGQQKDFRLYARWLCAGGLALPFEVA